MNLTELSPKYDGEVRQCASVKPIFVKTSASPFAAPTCREGPREDDRDTTSAAAARKAHWGFRGARKMIPQRIFRKLTAVMVGGVGIA
jgi:hypothetical protein